MENKKSILWFEVTNENDKKLILKNLEEVAQLIYKNSATFRNLPYYEIDLLNNEYNSISQEKIIMDLFQSICLMEDEIKYEIRIFFDYKFKIKVIRLKRSENES